MPVPPIAIIAIVSRLRLLERVAINVNALSAISKLKTTSQGKKKQAAKHSAVCAESHRKPTTNKNTGFGEPDLDEGRDALGSILLAFKLAFFSVPSESN